MLALERTAYFTSAEGEMIDKLELCQHAKLDLSVDVHSTHRVD